MHALGELGQDVVRALVEDRVRRVEAKAVDVVVAHPHALRSGSPTRGRRPARSHRVAPERVVPVGEVRAEGADRLGAGADVVVDDVEQDAEAGRVGGVDEAREPVRAAVGGVRRVGVDAVVAPAALAGEGGDGHQLDRGHAQLAQALEVRDHAVERALLRERPDVQLVDDEVVERDAVPRGVRPAEAARVDDLRRPADALRLEARAGIRPRLPVEDVQVVVARAGLQDRLPDAVAGRDQIVVAGGHANGGARRVRRPDAELHAPLNGSGPEGPPECCWCRQGPDSTREPPESDP